MERSNCSRCRILCSNISLLLCSVSVLEILSSTVNAWALKRTLWDPREQKCMSFARHLRALVRSEVVSFTLATIVGFEVIVSLVACLDSDVVETKRQSSDSNVC